MVASTDANGYQHYRVLEERNEEGSSRGECIHPYTVVSFGNWQFHTESLLSQIVYPALLI